MGISSLQWNQKFKRIIIVARLRPRPQNCDVEISNQGTTFLHKFPVSLSPLLLSADEAELSLVPFCSHVEKSVFFF